jgi:rare lipoprotein A
MGVATDTSGSDGSSSIAAPDATHDQRGVATWYGAAFAGKPTASGERFDPDAMTAAHRKLRFGTWVEVCRTDGSSRCVRVRINDRGPFGHTERVIDLSKHAASLLGIVQDGSGEVSIHVVDGPG